MGHAPQKVRYYLSTLYRVDSKHSTTENIGCACKMQAVAIKAGVGGQKDVFPIKCMTDESGPTPALQALVCTALQKALYYAEDYVSNRVDDHSDDDIKSELYHQSD